MSVRTYSRQSEGLTHVFKTVEAVVHEQRRVRPQILFQPMPYPGQPTPYPDQPTPYPVQPTPNPGQPTPYRGQPTFYPDNCRPILPTYEVERVEAVVHEERRVRPQVLLLQPLQHLRGPPVSDTPMRVLDTPRPVLDTHFPSCSHSKTCKLQEMVQEMVQ